MTRPKRVTLFIQCIVDSSFPEVGEAMVKVLERQGLTLDYPAGQTCCGQPASTPGTVTRRRGWRGIYLDVHPEKGFDNRTA
jgi:L-lactate dehydrogenase complex protein LldE